MDDKNIISTERYDKFIFFYKFTVFNLERYYRRSFYWSSGITRYSFAVCSIKNTAPGRGIETRQLPLLYFNQ